VRLTLLEPSEKDHDPDPEVVDVADEDLERWELWIREDGAS
jgi:hypothetical protein